MELGIVSLTSSVTTQSAASTAQTGTFSSTSSSTASSVPESSVVIVPVEDTPSVAFCCTCDAVDRCWNQTTGCYERRCSVGCQNFATLVGIAAATFTLVFIAAYYFTENNGASAGVSAGAAAVAATVSNVMSTRFAYIFLSSVKQTQEMERRLRVLTSIVVRQSVLTVNERHTLGLR